MSKQTPFFERGTHRVQGVLAEVLSVLEESRWKTQFDAAAPFQTFVQALDSETPPEERVPLVTDLCRKLTRQLRLASWLPWYSRLAEHEYGNQFYPAYRDHSIHTLQVYLLGLYLYETVSLLRGPLDQRFGRQVGSTSISSSELFTEWWTVTALWHDWGYPFEATEFQADANVQQSILRALSEELGSNPFLNALGGADCLTRTQVRELYRKGSYFPLTLVSPAQVLESQKAKKVIDPMWRRLGVALDADSPSLALDLLTSQSAVGRPPYHDHGLFGAGLLALWADETESFLTNLVERLPGSDLEMLLPKIEAGWESLVTLAPLLDCSIEAIAFHNISFSQLTASGASENLVPAGYRANLELEKEPHLFFLALVDTLQDWDRHHFAPSGGAVQYRPQRKATSILIQGDGVNVRVEMQGVQEAHQEIARLFAGWLSPEDIESLLAPGPDFSLPEKITLAVPSDFSNVKRSERERDRLLALIDRGTAESRQILIEGGSESVMRSSSNLAIIVKQATDANRILTASDREAVERRLEDRGLNQLRSMAWSLIEEGTRLSMGRIERRIGGGGFGTVYEVQNSSGQIYAFKLYHQHDLNNKEKSRLFRRGYDAMAALSDHPNVVSVVSFSELPLGFYMELVPGANLEQGIEQLRSVHERLAVGMKIAETVAEAHARPAQILHRDIKPANVILDAQRDLEPVLTDFDLAWIENRQTQLTKALYANLYYGAPEQFEPRMLEYKQRPTVDIYSVGALMYFLLTKQDPPNWSHWSDVHWKSFAERLEGDLAAPVVSELAALLRRMLTMDPLRRPQEMQRVVQALNRIHAKSRSGGEEIDRHSWEEQVVYKATGRLGHPGQSFFSRAGGVEWRLHTSMGRQRKFSCRAELSLATEPHFEGVNYQAYRTKVARRIDERLHSFEAGWEGVKAVRTGFPTESTKAMIRFDGMACNLESATAVGNLISQINRAVE